MKRKRAAFLIAAALAVCLIGWRLWPRSIDSFLERPSGEAGRVYCSLSYWDVENGQPVSRGYELDAESGRESRNLMNILRRGQYQASFANLMPWTWRSGPTSTGSGKMILMSVFYDGERPEETEIVHLQFNSGFSRGNYGVVDGRRVHTIGNEMFDELAGYIMSEGERAESHG